MAAALETDAFEHFRILRREDGTPWELGRGAMGVTFKAVDTRLDSLVALKVIGARVLAHPAAHERFLREARAAASLRHPNVASVYHFGQEKTDYFYAMEFVEGQSVADAVRERGRLPWAVALDVARQLASALAAAHARQLVHRDIKPDNIMLTHEQGGEENAWQVKLIDFGLAKHLLNDADAPGHTMTVGFVGTPAYASPEQCAEEGCDIRSDLYSLGATLWYMLTGKPVFTGHVLKVLEQHLLRPPPFDLLPADVPPGGRDLLARLLAKRPDDRPQTPAELRREIDALALAPAPPPPTAVGEETVDELSTAASGDEPVSGQEAQDPPSAAPDFPAPLTRFFGRETEIATLCGWLRDGHRLVTLTGPGGTGKTRLCLEIASRVAPALGRQTFFVALSDLTAARFLARRVRDTLLPAAALGGNAAADETTLLASIVDALSVRPSLLVLDNFEQIAEEGAGFVARLLARVPTLRCLISSRRRLDLSGEREFAVATLSVPPAGGSAMARESLEQFASVQLFCDRAQAVRSDFSLNDQNAPAVAELCRQVDGIPLAIELAAARIEMLTPRQIVARLARSLDFLVGSQQDVAVRHRTLRALIDWSCDLLPTHLRLFFARLAVFRGGWTVEAAAALIDGGNADEALAQLGALRRFSLVLAEERGDAMRYRMLETIRQYAGEALARLGDEEAVSARRRHRDFFLALARQAEPELRKSDQAHWLALLETEHENFRAALARTNDGDPEQLGLSYCLHRFWMIHGHVGEGREWLARALAADGTNGATGRTDPLMAQAHNAAGVLAWSAGDLDGAQTHLEKSLAIHEAMGNATGAASALNNLGLVACERSDFATALTRHEASLALYRRTTAPSPLSVVLGNLGRVFFRQRMYADARRCLEESLALEVVSPDLYNRANLLDTLGAVETQEGNPAAAYRRFAECLTLRVGLGALNNFDVCWRLATLAASQGDKPEAARLLAAADQVRETLSLKLASDVTAKFQAEAGAVRGDLGPAEFTRCWEEGKTLSFTEIARRCREKIA